MSFRTQISMVLLIYVLCPQAQVLDDTISLGEVSVVHQQYSPPGIIKSRIDTVLLQDHEMNSIAEILHSYTPVFVKSYGNGGLATVSFRGTHASHTQVEWNGLNINSPMLGQVDFSNIPVFFVDVFELYHGNSSLINGSGGLGGGILLKTLPDWNNSYDVRLMGGAGSFNTYHAGLKFGIGNNCFQSKTRVFYNGSRNDFWYINNSEPGRGREQNENADFSTFHVMQELHTLIRSSHHIYGAVWIGKNDRSVPPLMNYSGIYRKENLTSNDLKISGGWEYYMDEESSVKINSGLCHSDLNYFLGDSADYYNMPDVFDTISNSSSNSTSIQNNVTWKRRFGGSWQVTVNAHYDYHSVGTYDDAPLSSSGYNADRKEYGGMATIEKNISPRLNTYLIARQDFADGDILPFSPLLGCKWSFTFFKDLYFTTNVSGNHHLPPLNALYWVPWGNPDLETESGYSVDFSMEYSGKFKLLHTHAKLTAYGSQIENWILWVPGKSAQNVREVFARGMEVNKTTTLNLGSLENTLRINYAYTLTTNEKSTTAVDNTIGNQLIYIPEHKLGVLNKFACKWFYAIYRYSYTGIRYTSMDNDLFNSLPEYALHDLTFGREFSINNITIDNHFTVHNLWDEDYQSVLYRAMPGRHYSFSLKFNYRKRNK